MEATLELKKELHELIEGIADEQILKVIRQAVLPYKKFVRKPVVNGSTDIQTKKRNLVKVTFPNGSEAYITPGDPTVDTSDLVGIWKDNPITAEELRQKAWGGRA
ncbi:MAG: hypothetical protein AAB316_05940 [Bacteroidota bacterium]